MKSGKARVIAKFHNIPTIRFGDQELIFFSGIICFSASVQADCSKKRLKRCFSHLKISRTFGHHLVTTLLVIHLIPGFKRLREIAY